MPGKSLTVALVAAVCMAQEPRLRSTAELVLVPVSVTDQSGHYIRDLSEEDLVLYDDNVAQRIQLEDITLPLSLALVVQTTPASQLVLDKLRKTTGIIGPMITGFQGEAAVVSFGRATQVVQQFTSNEADVVRALRRLDATGTGAGIAEAVTAALSLLAARPAERRRVLLLVSEKHDLASAKEQVGAAAMLAQRQNVTIYSVTFSPSRSQWTNKVPVYCDLPVSMSKCLRCTCGNCGNQCDREDGKPQKYVPNQAAYSMDLKAIFGEMAKLARINSGEMLARYTGGEQTDFATKSGLEGVFTRIGRDIHAQYLLSYQPSGAPGVFHRIRVEVKGRPGLTVRARPGYWRTEE